MNLANALSLLLQKEAARPSRETALFNTTIEPRNTEHFPTNDTWWKTGSLCIAMLHHNPSVVTPMMIVGARANKRYAITTEATPALVEFSTDDMKETKMRVAKTSTEKDTKLFVTEACAYGVRRGTRIVPLRFELLQHVFNEANEPRHPHELYHALKDIKTPSVRMLQAWAKAACLKTGTPAIRSSIELNPKRLPQFEDNLAHQVSSDITDAFIDEEAAHDDFVEALLKSIYPLVRPEQATDDIEVEEPLPPTTAPPTDQAAQNQDLPPTTDQPTPEPPTTEHATAAEQPPAPPHYDSDEVEDVTPPGANRHLESQHEAPDQSLQGQRHDRRPSNLSPYNEQRSQGRFPNRSAVRWENTYTNLDCPPLVSERSTVRTSNHSNSFGNSSTSAWNANNNAWNPTQPTPPSAETPWGSQSRSNSNNHMRSAATNHFTPSRSSFNTANHFNAGPASNASVKLKELTEIAIIRPLSNQEMNQWKVLHASIGTSTPNQADETKKNFLGMQQFSILAWAKTHPNDKAFLNEHNNHFWPKLNACKNKADARLVVETEMFQPLLRKNPKLLNCLHDDLKETIINFRFKPNNLDSDKPTLGLCPLAFVPRERREIEMMSHQIAINDEALCTTSDIDKTKLGRPKLPTSVDGYNSVIEACKTVNDFLFSLRGELVVLLQASLLALYENHHAYEHMENFGRSFGAEVLFQLTRATEQIYGQATSESQLLQGHLPSLNFDFLVNGIRNNNLNTSQARPLLFVPTQKKQRVQTPSTRTARGGGSSPTTGGGNGGRGAGGPTTPQKGTNGTVTRQLSEGMHTLIVNWKKTHKRGRMPSILDFRTASDIADDAALQALLHLNNTTCIRWALLGSCRKNCKREHPATITGFAETVAKISCEKDYQSKTRTH